MSLAGTRLTGVYHRFSAEQGRKHHGDELDAQISRTLFTRTDKICATVAIKFRRVIERSNLSPSSTRT